MLGRKKSVSSGRRGRLVSKPYRYARKRKCNAAQKQALLVSKPYRYARKVKRNTYMILILPSFKTL